MHTRMTIKLAEFCGHNKPTQPISLVRGPIPLIECSVRAPLQFEASDFIPYKRIELRIRLATHAYPMTPKPCTYAAERGPFQHNPFLAP